MATITLNVPTEKIQSFLSMLVQTGFEQSSNFIKNKVNQLQLPLSSKKDKRNVHPYYDWDFYNNELEYE